MHRQKTGEHHSKKMEKAFLCLIVLAMVGSYFIHDLLRIVFVLAMVIFLFRSFQDRRRNDVKRMSINLLVACIFFIGIFVADTN